MIKLTAQFYADDLRLQIPVSLLVFRPKSNANVIRATTSMAMKMSLENKHLRNGDYFFSFIVDRARC